MKELSNRVAVITGAASGIGRATALSLARRGVDVVIADLNEERMAEVAFEIEAAGRRSLAIRCDVSDIDDLTNLREQGVAAFGRVDIVMNNVGLLALGLPTDIPLQEWERTVTVNYLSVVRSMHIFVPMMLERGSGHIVNTASTAGLIPYAFDRLPYASTKAAIINLSENLALFAKPRGVGVTVYCPAGVQTNIGEGMRFFGDHRDISSPDLPTIPAEEAGEQIAKAIEDDQLFVVSTPGAAELWQSLASDADAYVNREIEVRARRVRDA
ncbi:SDR family NAD(P)-dependent oxidoreductase [Jatrophihabitans sp. DSM 45814]